MKLLALISLLCFSTVYFAQDLHLSQFYTNKANLNPSLSGNYDGSYQLTGNYRNQWRELGKPINSSFFSIDKRMYHYSNEFSVGFLFNDDSFSGFNQKVNKFLINGSYTTRIKSHTLRAGIQTGLIFRKTDLTNQTFPNQWMYETGEFDQTLSNGEVNLGTSQNSLDASLGLSWTKTFNKLTPTIGFSLFHFNRPKDSYFETHTERLRARKAFSAELDWKIKPTVTLEPKLLYMWTTKSQDLVIGTNVKKLINKDLLRNVFAGVLFRSGIGRNNDALIPLVGVGIDKFDLGFSYDVNISSLSNYNGRKSTLEFSIIYTVPMYNPTKLSIPCDRY